MEGVAWPLRWCRAKQSIAGGVLSTQQYEENNDECAEEKRTNAELWELRFRFARTFAICPIANDMQIHLSIKEESDRVCIRELVPS